MNKHTGKHIEGTQRNILSNIIQTQHANVFYPFVEQLINHADVFYIFKNKWKHGHIDESEVTDEVFKKVTYKTYH